MKTAQDRYKIVQRKARLNVKAIISSAGRLDLWGLAVTPNRAIVVRTSIDCGFTRTDALKLAHLFYKTLVVRA